MPIRVFVYGTLKQGKHNHRLLGDSRHLGRGYIEGNFRLVSLGAFPGIVKSGRIISPGRAVGEVYQVSDDVLRTLDYLEGHPRFYRREKVETQFGSAWCYFLPESYLEKYPVVEGDIWQATPEEKEWYSAYRAA